EHSGPPIARSEKYGFWATTFYGRDSRNWPVIIDYIRELKWRRTCTWMSHRGVCEEVSGTSSRHQLQHPPFFLLRLLVTALITAAFMGIYEAVKQWMYPEIAIWQSHAVTIVFSAMITTVAMFVGLRRYELLSRQLRQSEEKYQALFDSIDEGFCVVEVL